MSLLMALLLLITAGTGILSDGLYRPFMSESMAAFQFFQDLVSLLLVPLLLVALYLAYRGSLRAFVVWLGILIYAAYYYAFYSFGFVYTIYYPLYLAVMGLAIYSLAGLVGNADLQFFRQHVGDKMPIRLIAVVLGSTVLFIPLWLTMLVQHINTQQVGATDLVFVLDLPFLIPACLLAAVLVWQRRPFGYLLSGPLLFKATVSGILLAGGELVKMQRGMAPAFDQLAIYLFLAIVGSIGIVRYMGNLDDEKDKKARSSAMLPLR